MNDPIIDVLERYPGAGSKRLVLLAITARIDAKSWICWPTMRMIASDARLSERQVKRLVSQLVEESVLEVAKVNAQNAYRVRMDRIRSMPDLYVDQRSEKDIARGLAQRAVVTGKLERPDTCSQCGVSCKAEGHHDDYSKPLEVVWLCHPCHMELHAKLRREVAE